jgi:ActR/RegA family two-component response regulator
MLDISQAIKRLSDRFGSAKTTPLQNAAKCPNRDIPRVMAISKDDQFLATLRCMAVDSTWDFREPSSLTDAMSVLLREDIPIVVLDQAACERNWEACVSALVHLRRVPCVILAAAYGDEYARLEMIRLGGYDVVDKCASPDVISRAIEFAWFWSQYSPPRPPAPPINSVEGRKR